MLHKYNQSNKVFNQVKNNLYVMSKVPFMGISKKRLTKDIGFIKSKRLTNNNLEKIKKIFIKNKKKYLLYWYLTPAIKFRSYSFRFSSNCILQKGNNMGERIWYLAKNKKKSFILIGSDILGINQDIISQAFYHLKNHDMVIGPTEDGGFWLIGFSKKKKISYPFNNIRWSTSNTFKDLIANLDKIKISYKITTKLRDIDNKDDYCKNKYGLEINL